MSILSVKFASRNIVFVHEWLSTRGNSPIYWRSRTPLPAIFDLYVETIFKIPFDQPQNYYYSTLIN